MLRLLAVLCGLALGVIAHAGVEEDWEAITALDAGPRAGIADRDRARQITIAHLDIQEKALRNFLTKYPADPRSLSARLRLAHLLAVRGDMQSSPKPAAEAKRILDELERSPSTPVEKKPDVSFAKISLAMRRGSQRLAREKLLLMAREFQRSYPQDRRVAPLLAEIATLFDSDPEQKRALLEEALHSAPGDELKQRIGDDLKRISLLGKPLALEFADLGGAPVSLESYRGKVVLLVFFADWSPPSIESLQAAQRACAGLSPDTFQPVGISLDENKEALLATLKQHKINWPVFFDGAGWASPVARSFGINALPTIWVLDRAGNLRTLNARDDFEAVIRRLIREPK